MIDSTDESTSTNSTNPGLRFEIIEGESESETRKRQFAKKYGVKCSDRHACVNRLIGKRCGIGNLKCVDPCPRIPAGDHLSLWNKDGKPFVIVSQPYGLTWSALVETVQFCERYGLRPDIDTWPSWHSPGKVLTILYFRNGTRAINNGVELSTKPNRKNQPPLKLLPQQPSTVICDHTELLDMLNDALDRHAEVGNLLEIVSRALFNGVTR